MFLFACAPAKDSSSVTSNRAACEGWNLKACESLCKTTEQPTDCERARERRQCDNEFQKFSSVRELTTCPRLCLDNNDWHACLRTAVWHDTLENSEDESRTLATFFYEKACSIRKTALCTRPLEHLARRAREAAAKQQKARLEAEEKEKRRQLLKSECERENIAACTSLAMEVLSDGDKAKAFSIAKDACEKGMCGALVAYYLKMGEGEKAKVLAVKACEEGDNDSCTILSIIRSSGAQAPGK